MHWIFTTRWPRARIELAAMAAMAAFSFQASSLVAQTAPGWWTSRGVITPGAAADDYAVINQGQLKNLAKAACDELNANLPGGAGEAINGLVSTWQIPGAETEDYAVVTQGQLKALAAPFYDRLTAAGRANGAPWAGSTATPDNYAPANIGQAKQLFGFVIPAGGGDGTYGSGASDVPLTLTVLSGSNQTVTEGATTAGPLVVRATREGVPWAGVSVTFTTGSGSLGGGAQSVTAATSSLGYAAVSYTAATGGSGTQTVSAAAEDASVAVTVHVVDQSGNTNGSGQGGTDAPSSQWTAEQLAAADAAYEIGLQERGVGIGTEIEYSGGEPDDPDGSTADKTYRAFRSWDEEPVWEAGPYSYFADGSNNVPSDELARGAGLVHDAVDGMDLPDWEEVNASQALTTGRVEATAFGSEGVGAGKAEFRLVRRLKGGATPPLDDENNPIKPEIKRTFLKVTTVLDGAGNPTTTAEAIPFTIIESEDISTTTTGELFPPQTDAGTYRIDLLPVEVKEVISDQLAGSECNKLPTAYFGGNPAKPENGHPNNPMLMATRTGQKAKLKVKMGSTDPKVYVGARRVNTQTVLGSASASSATLDLEFDVPANSHNAYEIVAGYDTNGNSKLDDDEAKVVFEKTPRIDKEGNKSTANLQWLDKIIIVDSDQFVTSKTETIDYSNFPFTGFAGDLLRAFANGTTSVTGTDGFPPAAEVDASIIPSADGLSHPLGARWASNCRAQTHRLVFTKQSEAAGELAGSAGFLKVIDEVINDNVANLIAAADGDYTAPIQSSPIFFNNKSVNFAVTDPYSKAHVAIGKGRFGGELTVHYRLVTANQIEVEVVNCDASCFDLYDFAYGAPAINIMWMTIDPKNPTMVQAGHASLATGAAPKSGQVFFTQVDFETSKLMYNQVYPHD